MVDRNTYCPIWGVDFSATVRPSEHYLMDYVDSPRSGGEFKLYHNAMGMISELSSQKKAQLTSWIIDQHRQGIVPEVTKEIIDYLKTKRPAPAYERADGLLRYIAERIDTLGADFFINMDDVHLYGRSESIQEREVAWLINYLLRNSWLETMPGVADRDITGYRVPTCATVSVAGYRRIADVRANSESSQAFIAMWFDDSMNRIFEEAIRPAIEEAGYDSLRIDQKLDANKIDDEIIAEIRRSRFLVADFTHGDNGARGGVYFEAGFAFGLGIPVIYTCRSDMVDKLHFDTRQYHHIVWERPEELRDELKNRILARIGKGAETK